MKNYYVYIYLDPRKRGKYKYDSLNFNYEPFYVGKGKGVRYRDHLSKKCIFKENPFKARKIQKIKESNLKPIIIFYKRNLSCKRSLLEEMKLIKNIGRYPKGPLTNLTNGGEGSEGFKHSKNTIELLKRMRLGKVPWNKGLTVETDIRVKLGIDRGSKTKRKLHLSSGKNNPMWGKRGKLSPIYGIRKSKEHKIKISKSRLGLKNPRAKICKITIPDGSIVCTCVNEFIRVYGKKYKINAYFIRSILNDGVHRNGWSAKYL